MTAAVTLEVTPTPTQISETPVPVDDGGIVPPPASPEDPWWIKWVFIAVGGLLFFTKGLDKLIAVLDKARGSSSVLQGLKFFFTLTPQAFDDALAQLLVRVVQSVDRLQALLDASTQDLPYRIVVTVEPKMGAATQGQDGGNFVDRPKG